VVKHWPMIESTGGENHGVVISWLRCVAPLMSTVIPVMTTRHIAHDTVWKVLPHAEREVNLKQQLQLQQQWQQQLLLLQSVRNLQNWHFFRPLPAQKFKLPLPHNGLWSMWNLLWLWIMTKIGNNNNNNGKTVKTTTATQEFSWHKFMHLTELVEIG